MNGYESYHPAVQFLYYALAVGFSMVSMHPVVIAASIIGGMLLFSIRNTPRKIVEELFFFFCLFFMLAVMNPIFIHSGETCDAGSTDLWNSFGRYAGGRAALV